MFDAVKYVDEVVSASTRIFSSLGWAVSKYVAPERSIAPTERRTPIPAKIAFAGGNA